MEAKNESTKHFVNKTGDKVIIELEISGDPDEAMSKLMKSMARDEKLFESAKVSQIYFAGKDIKSIVENIKGKIITNVNSELLKLEDKLTGATHSVDNKNF